MKVSIQNFQSIKDLSFEIKGFTTIVGRGGIGKSAIIRAIRGALRNTKGDYFIRNGADTCQVILEEEGKFRIEWEKGKGNKYVVNDTRLESVGQSIPKEVQDCGFRVLDVLGKEFTPQIADQFNPLFLLTETGGTRAEVLADVSRINVLNQALALMEKDRKSAVSEGKSQKLKLEDVEAKLLKFQDLAVVKTLYANLQGVEANLEKYRQILNKLNKLHDQITQVGAVITQLSKVATLEIPNSDLSEAIRVTAGLAQHHIEIERHSLLVSQLSNSSGIQVPSQDYTKQIHDLDRLNAIRSAFLKVKDLLGKKPEFVALPTMDLSQSFTELKAMQTAAKSITQVTTSVNTLSEDISKICSQIETTEEEIKLIKTTNECPLCGASNA
jgi:DNA repair ATPase RecN